MSHELPLGQIIDGTQQRDAIHIAVAPVIAAEHLRPGDHVGFIGADTTEEVSTRARQAIGIVDPFLTVMVKPGQRFFMFLYPQTITSLRHDWTHPAFDGKTAPTTVVTDKEASEKWLREWAEKFPGWSLERLLESAENKLQGGYGENSHHDIPNGAYDQLPEFWRHYEIVTGLKVDDDSRGELPFYCGC